MELLSRLVREFMCQVDSVAGAELTTADDTRRVFEAMDEAASKVLGLNKAWSHWEGRGRSEFLCDYSIRRESKLGPMIIALESEWGKQSSAKITLEEVVCRGQVLVDTGIGDFRRWPFRSRPEIDSRGWSAGGGCCRRRRCSG